MPDCPLRHLLNVANLWAIVLYFIYLSLGRESSNDEISDDSFSLNPKSRKSSRNSIPLTSYRDKITIISRRHFSEANRGRVYGSTGNILHKSTRF